MAGIAAGISLAWHSGLAHARVTAPDAENQRNIVWVGEHGTASYYGAAHHGRKTASGVIFNQDALTAAHPWLPFGTKVRVTIHGTDRSVIVVVTDRLYSSTRIIDLSMGAAQHLGMIRQGLARVALTPA